MFVVDTNILVYAANKRARQNRAAAAAIEEWRSGPEQWFVTWSILYEFMRVATHSQVFSSPLTFAESWCFIESLFLSPSFGALTETERHPQIVGELSAEYPAIAGNPMHDLHIAALMREHGVTEIRTADTDFHQFRFLRVVNPL